MLDWRDVVAVGVFVAIFAASCLAEYFCGNDSRHCHIDWGGVYRDKIYHPGHCGKAIPEEAGLGDPLLSVSSLFFVTPIVYWHPTVPFATPLLSVFLGAASFLFHAANNNTTHTLDWIGVTTLAPAILADLVANKGYPRAGKAVFAGFLLTNILVRVLVEHNFPSANNTFEIYLYAVTPTATVITLFLIYRWNMVGQFGGGAVFLVGGSATLIVANNIDRFWGCIDTQLAEPHFWGHLLVAIGATLFCRATRKTSKEEGYTALN